VADVARLSSQITFPQNHLRAFFWVRCSKC